MTDHIQVNSGDDATASAATVQASGAIGPVHLESNSGPVLLSLHVFGCFCIGYNLAIGFHELGHVIAVWTAGGSVAFIELSPFTWSSTYYASNPAPLFSAWGGVLFGVPFCLALALAGIKFGPRGAALVMTGLCALGVNGIYFFVGAIAKQGDPAALLWLGVPGAVVIGIALVLMLAGIVAAGLVQPPMGLPPSFSMGRRTAILLAGIGPYLLAMLTFNLVSAGDGPIYFAFVGGGFLVILLMALSGHLMRAAGKRFAAAEPPSPRLAALEVLLGIGTVGAIWLW